MFCRIHPKSKSLFIHELNWTPIRSTNFGRSLFRLHWLRHQYKGKISTAIWIWLIWYRIRKIAPMSLWQMTVCCTRSWPCTLCIHIWLGVANEFETWKRLTSKLLTGYRISNSLFICAFVPQIRISRKRLHFGKTRLTSQRLKMNFEPHPINSAIASTSIFIIFIVFCCSFLLL